MKHLLLFILVTTSCCSAFAQTLKVDGEVAHWEANLLGGLNTDGYQCDFGVAYFPIQYVGVKANVGVAGEIKEISDWGKDEWESGHEYALRFKFIPALVLRTPRIINWKSQDGGLYFFAESGIILSPGASGSRKAKTFNTDFKAGVNCQFDQLIFFVGYGVSDYSLYSGGPDNHQGLPDKYDYTTHSVFVGLAYKF